MLAAETKLTLDIPRERDGSFELQLIAKHQRRLPGFDDRVVSLYARGLPVREIQGHLTELIKNRGHFPNDEAATKLIWLALRNIAKN